MKDDPELKTIVSISDLAFIAKALKNKQLKNKLYKPQLSIFGDIETITAIEEIKQQRGAQEAERIAEIKIIKTLSKKHQRRGRLRQFVNTNEMLKNNMTKEAFNILLDRMAKESKIIIIGSMVYKC